MDLPANVAKTIAELRSRGFAAYVVGGSVRDMIMGRTIGDWDFTTDAKPEDIVAAFPDSFYDNRFGTVGVKIYADEAKTEVTEIFEVTTYRSEQGYTDRRHPDTVTWGKTVEEDLARRDFTINAIATDGTTVIDPFGGREDIERKVLRTVGNPDERFAEDALRMMRAVRIAAQLGFSIDPTTMAAITKNAALIRDISAERIREELMKLLASPYPADGIMVMKATGILAVILPELDAAFAVGQKSPKRHHIHDVGTHSVLAMRHCPSTDPVVRFATLVHDIGKPKTYQKDEAGIITFYNHEVVGAKIVRDICRRLRFPKKDAERIDALIRWHQFSVDERQTDSAIRRILRHVGPENMADMLALRIGDRLGGGALETSWRLELFKKRLEEVQKQPFSVKDLKVNGHDVMTTLSCAPGPVIGKMLDTLFAEVEAGTLANERDVLLKRMEELSTTVTS